MFNSAYEVLATTLLIVCDFMDCRHFQNYDWYEKEFDLTLNMLFANITNRNLFNKCCCRIYVGCGMRVANAKEITTGSRMVAPPECIESCKRWGYSNSCFYSPAVGKVTEYSWGNYSSVHVQKMRLIQYVLMFNLVLSSKTCAWR